MLNRLSLITGQVVPTYAAIPAATSYVLASALFSLSLVPVSMTVTRSPTPPKIVTLRVRQLWNGSPISVIGCLYVGLVAGALVNIVPVFGVAVRLDERAVGLLTASVQVGSLILAMAARLPVGPHGPAPGDARRRLPQRGGGDHPGPGRLGTSAAALTLAFAVIGGTSLPIYALSVAHASDKFGRDHAVALSSSLLFTWAVGSIAGPILVTGMMQALGASGFVYYIAGLSAGFVVFTVWRLARQKAPSRQAGFIPVPDKRRRSSARSIRAGTCRPPHDGVAAGLSGGPDERHACRSHSARAAPSIMAAICASTACSMPSIPRAPAAGGGP